MASVSQEIEPSVDSKKPHAWYGFFVIAVLVAICVAYSPNFAVADEGERPIKAAFTALPAGEILVIGGGIAAHLGEFDLEIFRLFASEPTTAAPCAGFQCLELLKAKDALGAKS